ncbi:MAG: hypothetical protein AB8G15_14620 [Saprospiraceae bacterium]
MSAPKFNATMMIPKDGHQKWTDIMQNPPKNLPQGVTEGQYIVASYAQFSDGVSVFGGVAVGPADQDFNYALFMVFDADNNQVGGWPIDTSDWEGFSAQSIQFGIEPDDEDGNYLLQVTERS